MIVTVTPNKRLARALARDEAEVRSAAGERAWHRNPVMPWMAWMESLLDEHIACGDVGSLPLASHQSLLVWTEIVSEDVAVNAGGVAAMAQRAWSRMHQWLLSPVSEWSPFELSVDSEQFSRWAQAYEEKLEASNWIDNELWIRRLPGLIASREVPLPDELVLAGFSLGLSPAQQAVIDALEEAGVTITTRDVGNEPVHPLITSGKDRDDEMELAAAWVREHLDAGWERIALVVPDLATRFGEVDRVLRRALRPDVARLEPHEELPWHLALGAPLSQFPVVAQALEALRLDPDSLELITLSALLRSPYIAGWRDEQAARAALDFDLRTLPGDDVSLSRLRAAIERSGESLEMLTAHLDAWSEARQSGGNRRLPSSWAEQFCSELSGIGFGSGRVLSSAEYQAWEALQGVLEQFASLDAVSGPVNRGRAVGLLSDLVGKRLFREKNPGCPVEVMTVPEALGGEFDAVWVVGMDDSRWPAPVQPDPLIPRQLQAECPDATAEGQLARAKASIAGLCRTAARVVVSYAELEGELPMRCSELIDGDYIPADELIDDRYRPFPEAAPLETHADDSRAPQVTESRARGGTRVLQSQAACPFKAMAEHRLGAVSVEEPRAGLSPRDRGSLLHYALEDFWRKTRDSDALHALDASQLRDRAGESANYAVSRMVRRNPAVMSEHMRSLEVSRLTERLVTWLNLEMQRPAFRVKAVEEKRELEAGGLTFDVKLDRVDEVASGGDLLIDYKSGASKPTDWYPDQQIADPQVPAYTLTMDDAPAGLAFGLLRPDQLGFSGLSRDDLQIKGITALGKSRRGVFREHENWDGLVEEWKAVVHSLAEDFREGYANVAPRHPRVCEFCELKSLCRLRQRMEMAG